MVNNLALKTLDELEDRVKRKLEKKKSELFYSGKRMEGYKEAMHAVLSMIHELKG